MADSLVNIYSIEFSDNIMLLARQENSRMLGKVMMKMDVKGDRYTQERIGIWSMSSKTQGVVATPTNDPLYTRRVGIMTTVNDSRQAARDDDLKTKVAISSPWVKAAGSAIGNSIDAEVFRALGADANADTDTGGATVALPAGQKKATLAGEVLTTDFIIEVKAILDANNVPQNGRRVMIHPNDLNALLKDDTVQNSDYNTIKTLVKGEIDTWLGFEWIMTTNATEGTVYFFQEDGICLGMNESPYVNIRTRYDLSDAQEIYYELNIGAVRLEEERVVEVTITPAV